MLLTIWCPMCMWHETTDKPRAYLTPILCSLGFTVGSSVVLWHTFQRYCDQGIDFQVWPWLIIWIASLASNWCAYFFWLSAYWSLKAIPCSLGCWHMICGLKSFLLDRVEILPLITWLHRNQSIFINQHGRFPKDRMARLVYPPVIKHGNGKYA